MLSTESRQQLRAILIEDEDLRLHPYVDTVGKITIGVGRNLNDRGITNAEALYLLENDIQYFQEKLKEYPWFDSLNDPRKIVLISMCFNLGLKGLLSFKKMIAALKAKDYEKAYREMLDSKWAIQVGDREIRLAKMMREGVL